MYINSMILEKFKVKISNNKKTCFHRLSILGLGHTADVKTIYYSSCGYSTVKLQQKMGSPGKSHASIVEKYSLRRRDKREKRTFQSEVLVTPKMQSNKGKSKTKPAPLSKYRRKTANARERTRMREINTAFEDLRKCVPVSISYDEQNLANEKLTKIATLRMAMRYIKILSEALDNPNHDINYLTNLKKNFWELSSDNNNSGDTGKTATKKSEQSITLEKIKHKQKADIGSIAKNMKKAVSKSETQIFVESAGKSLHFSESCLSPFKQDARSLCELSLADECVELTLLLESKTDNIDILKNSYINSMAQFDSFTVSSDLEFMEHMSFDTFLA